MSKHRIVLTALVLASTLSGCGKKEEAPGSAPPPLPSAISAPLPPAELPKTEAEDPKAHADGPQYSDQAGSFTPPPAIGIEYEKSDSPPGVQVTLVVSDSVAAKSGVKVGDVIVAVGGFPVTDATNMRETVSFYPSGSHIELTVIRNGSTQINDIFLP